MLALQRREGLVRRSKLEKLSGRIATAVTKWIDSVDVATSQSDIGFHNWLSLWRSVERNASYTLWPKKCKIFMLLSAMRLNLPCARLTEA